jgi:phenylacetate-coenzyme A ligase PaaK-like adenylate-forming protein
VALCGTSFAFVHLLDALDARGVRPALPAGSRVMETGGFKGRSRELSRESLHEAIADRLGVPPERIVNQYGMTELGSQFYDSVLRRPGEPRRKLAPPWARVRAVDPDTGDDVPAGEPGALVIVDLANTGSLQAVQTADLGRLVDDGFEVLGREPGAEARGCSIAADAMLGTSAP